MNKLFTKIIGVALGLTMAIGLGVAVSANQEAVPAFAYTEVSADSLDLTGKKYGSSAYNSTLAYGKWTIKYGANNNKSWTYFKMGGKDTTISSSNPCEIYMTSPSTKELNKVTVSGPSGSLSKSGMSVTSWKLVVANDANFSTVYDTVNGTVGDITKSAWSSDFKPSTGKTWSEGKYFKVSWTLANTSGTNGIVCVDHIKCFEGDPQSISGSTTGTVGTGVILTTSATSASWAITGGTGTATLTPSTGKTTTVNATAAGTVVVTASGDGLKNATHTIEFASASAETITVTGTSSMYVGDASISLTATPSNFTPASYTWTSSQPGVATVSGTGTTGTVSAVAKGTTYITASAQGSSGTVVSNSFIVTVKQFSIALSTASVSMKASKSTTVTVTPTDANGTVIVTAESNNTSVATTSVSGTTITITSGSDGGASTTITVSAKDNNGVSGYHTAANKTISVEVTAGYVVGNKITALPSSDKFVFLGNADQTSWVGGTGTDLPETTNDEDAAIFVLSSTGTIRYYNQDSGELGNYISGTNGSTSVSYNASSCVWDQGMSDSTYPGLLKISGDKGRFLMFNASVVKAYAYSNVDNQAANIIYAYEATASTPTVALSGDSVTGLKGNPADTSLTLTISNFTATGLNVTYKDDGESSFSASSDVATVTCGHSSGSNTVSVGFDGVGSTTVKLSVTRGSGDPIEKTFTVSVSPKPASITINNTLKSGYLEVRNSNSASTYGYQELDITALDTDGNPYEGQLDYSVESGSSYIGLSDAHRVYGKAVGTGVVKVSAHALSSVYAEVNVKSMDDTKTGVKSITFNSSLTANAGDVLSISDVIATKKAKSYFGYSEGLDIDDSELLFSYSEHDYENAVPAASFIYACDEETAVGDPENQTVYVYCTLDSTWSDSFQITVTQTNNAVTGVAISNVSDHAKTITRTDSFQLTLAFTPSNATNKNVTYSLSNQSTGSTITVSQTGLVSAGTRAGSTARVTVTTEDGGFTDYVNITVGIEEMSYDIVEPLTVSVASSISVGDRIFLAAEGTKNSSTVKKYMTGYTASYGQVSDYTDSPDASEAYVLDVVAGASNGQFAFKYGNNYLSYSGSSNTLNTTTEISAASSWTVSISNGKATITNANSSTRVIWYNVSSPRFACYTNKTDGSDYFTPIIYKISGGNSSHDVDAVLLNAVLDNFGSGKTYEWNDSCTAFDEDAWLDACIALTEITNYSSYKLNRAVGNIAGNEVEQFIAKYDIIIGKFGKTHDHLDRYAQGGINYGVRSGVSPLVNIIGENTNTFAIIVIISMISVAAISGYFFLRERKED